ncbi:hypothetical protein CIPAW_03G178900 [Carya illinoinensis]|uniref:Uncharacterized protein n=1 Tax=Carya illinoinensis TaxID=32201 RepID=A0A8T1R506_CARIL|nr:hypothetical protein CIPAW_03G178900 [Carya illinoinensis]
MHTPTHPHQDQQGTCQRPHVHTQHTDQLHIQ